MGYVAEPTDRVELDQREKGDIDDFLAALREIRASSGWGEIVFTITAGDISYHDVKIRKRNLRKKTVVTKEY